MTHFCETKVIQVNLARDSYVIAGDSWVN